MSATTTPMVPVGPLQDAVERTHARGWTYDEIAAWCGFLDNDQRGDGSRLKRILGLARQPGGGTSAGYFNANVGEENSVKIILGLGLFPRDFGI